MAQEELAVCSEELIDRVLTAATNVHRALGPGLLESIYEAALMRELRDMGIRAESQVEIPVLYKGENLGVGFRADIIVGHCLLLELKAVKELTDIDMAKTINYLKLLRFKTGISLEFQ